MVPMNHSADQVPAPKLTPTRLDALRAVAAGKVTKHRELNGGGHFWVRDRARVAKTPYEWLRTNGLIRAVGVTFLRAGTFEPTELGHRTLEAAGTDA